MHRTSFELAALGVVVSDLIREWLLSQCGIWGMAWVCGTIPKIRGWIVLPIILLQPINGISYLNLVNAVVINEEKSVEVELLKVR